MNSVIFGKIYVQIILAGGVSRDDTSGVTTYLNTAYIAEIGVYQWTSLNNMVLLENGYRSVS